MRRLLDAGTQVQGLAYSEFEAIDDVIDRAERSSSTSASGDWATSSSTSGPLLDEELDRLEKRYENKGIPTGRMTPFEDLNYMTSGCSRPI